MKIEGAFCFQNDSKFNTVLLKNRAHFPTSLENVASNKFNISKYFDPKLKLNTGMLKQ